MAVRDDGQRERDQQPDPDGDHRELDVLHEAGPDLLPVGEDPIPPDQLVGERDHDDTISCEIRSTVRIPR